MWCYDKKGNEVRYSEAVKYKKLYNKAEKIIKELENYKNNNLMFEFEDEETKQNYYNAIHELKKFRDNLRLKDKYSIENGLR